MCGIAGFTHKGRVVSPELIRSAVHSIVHRGPDQQGVFETGDVSLGVVRLKIIDLVGGQQPMKSDDGKTVIVFNGEVYNHDELRRELESHGHRFHSRSDTEVVLRSFLQWDLDALKRLRGMFALAIWNEGRKRLVLARDRMGIKPLYIHRRGENIYFGSELKTLFVHPEIERQIDPAGLNCYLRLNWVPAPHTLVKGIEKLLPGQYLEWIDGKEQVEPYWTLPEGRILPRNLKDATSELEWRLKQAVREHLVSDVPLGVWASGGIDSSTILHYAAEASSNPLNTFSVTFKGRSFDESPWIREAAEKYATHHQEFDLGTDIDIKSAIEEFAYYSDEPSADAGALPVWFLAKMSRRHVTVALSGEGADELFGGYVTYTADRYAAWARMLPQGLRSATLRIAKLLPVSDDKISLEYKLKRFLQGALLGPADAHVYWNGTFTEEEKREILKDSDAKPMQQMFQALASGGDIGRFLTFDQRFYLADDILYKVDRMSMAHSLEVRPPFLDHRIVEFANSLPTELKVKGNTLKYVLRELMADKLPKSILTRAKTGFDIPAHDWFRTILKPMLTEVVTEERVRATGIFSWEGVKRVMDDHFARRANYGYHLWGLLTLFLWMQRWNIQTTPTMATRRPARTDAMAVQA